MTQSFTGDVAEVKMSAVLEVVVTSRSVFSVSWRGLVAGCELDRFVFLFSGLNDDEPT
jgi:hypothetical protein